MSLQERYTHYDCLLPLAFLFVSGILFCYYVHRESDIAWVLGKFLISMNTTSIKQITDYWLDSLVRGLLIWSTGIDLLSTGTSSFSLSAAARAWPAPARHRGKLLFSLTPPHHWIIGKHFVLHNGNLPSHLQNLRLCGKHLLLWPHGQWAMSGGP